MEILIIVVIGAFIGLVIRFAMNAGKSNTPTECAYSCSKETLVEAVKKAAEKIGYTIEQVDLIGGRIKLGVKASMSSFGEWVHIQVMKVSENETKVTVSSTAKKGRENLGKNRKNIEKLLDAISSVLSE